MTRRGAIIGALLLAGGKLMAQGDKTVSATGNLDWWKRGPTNLQFGFGGPSGFKALVVTFGDGAKVTLTEADIQRELTHQHTAQRWGQDSLFLVDGRRLEVCAECGETFWEPGR